MADRDRVVVQVREIELEPFDWDPDKRIEALTAEIIHAALPTCEGISMSAFAVN